MAVSVSALGPLASSLSNTSAWQRLGPQRGLLRSALQSALVVCKLAVGVYSPRPGWKIEQPVALTPAQPTGGWLSGSAEPLLGLILPLPPGPTWASGTVPCRGLTAVVMGYHSRALGLEGRVGSGVFDQLSGCRGFLWAV